MTETPIVRASWREICSGDHAPRIATLCFAVWLHSASSMLVATTIPSAIAEFGGVHLVGWTFTLYQLGAIVVGAVTGLLVLKLGLRRALVGAAAIYLVASVLCAMAPEMWVMLVGRLMQGVGGGGLLALVYVALGRLFPINLMPRAIALTSAVWSGSAFFGPLIGGAFATAGLWRLAYWAFGVQAAVLIAAILMLIGDDRTHREEVVPGIPFRRLVVLAVAVMLVAIAGASGTPIVSPLFCVASLLAFWGFLRLDRVAGNSRMFPEGVLVPTSPVGASLVAVFTLAAATMSLLVYGPFLLASLHGLSALEAGYVIALESIAWGIAAVVFSSAGEESEKFLIFSGSIIITTSLAAFAFLMPNGPLWAIIVAAVCQGGGFGIMWGFVVRRVVAAAPEAERERTSSSLPATLQIGLAIGAAASGIAANAVGFSEGASVDIVRDAAFWVFAAFVPLALVGNWAAWMLVTSPSR